MFRLSYLLVFASFAASGFSQAVAPTHRDVPCSLHPKQVLDFWQAKSEQAKTPLLFFIHGGGWMTSEKANPDFLAKCLENGISVASINYRLIQEAQAAMIDPPVKACLKDAARALQFVRSKAAEWRLDKERIGGCGGSAGSFTALWLAVSSDMAEVKSTDPVARESTRLRCVMAFVPQTTLDPAQIQAWIPNNAYGNHAFGLPSMAELMAKRDSLLPCIEKYPSYALASADDPPVLLFDDNPPNLGLS